MLNSRQSTFACAVAGGKSLTDSYLLAYPEAEKDSARSAAPRLMKSPDVSQEIARLRADVRQKTVLSAIAKREFLAAIIEKPPAAPPRVSDQLRAVELDNKMAGHNHGDYDDPNSNAFSLIVNLTQNNVGVVSGYGVKKEKAIEMAPTERLQ